MGQPIPFPDRQLILKCRACEEHFEVPSGYDMTQDRLCGECQYLKKILAPALKPRPITSVDWFIDGGLVILAGIVIWAVGSALMR